MELDFDDDWDGDFGDDDGKLSLFTEAVLDENKPFICYPSCATELISKNIRKKCQKCHKEVLASLNYIGTSLTLKWVI